MHVVNDLGYWGRGFTESLDKFDERCKHSYLQWMKTFPSLGDTCVADIGSIKVAHMLAQKGVGKQKRRLQYWVLEKCLNKVAQELDAKYKIVCPKIGCGLAGGDWKIVKKIIDKCLYSFEVIVCVL